MEGFDIRCAEPSASAKRVIWVKFFNKANVCFTKFDNISYTDTAALYGSNPSKYSTRQNKHVMQY
jgi:hypothetical protein